MNEIEKWKEELWKTLETFNRTKYYLSDRISHHIFDVDFDEIIDFIKHLLGFLDAMIKFKIKLLPEQY